MVNLALKRDTGAPPPRSAIPTMKRYAIRSRASTARSPIGPPNSPSLSMAKRRDRAPFRLEALSDGLGLQGVGSAEFATVFVVSENYFSVLGVKMLQGRGFESIGITYEGDTQPGGVDDTRR